MATISIRGLNEELTRRLKKEAAATQKSVNQLVLDLLTQHVGLDKKKKFTHKHHDLDELFGRWNEENFNAIQGKIDSERQIDDELWK